MGYGYLLCLLQEWVPPLISIVLDYCDSTLISESTERSLDTIAQTIDFDNWVRAGAENQSVGLRRYLSSCRPGLHSEYSYLYQCHLQM